MKLRVFVLVAISSFALLAFFLQADHSYASGSSVVINELMYHPASEVDNDEYIELYNTSSQPVDLSGWCFTAGVSGCIASGTTINGQGYAVIGRSSSQLMTTYGVTAAGIYTGKLDNGGEQIVLKDASGNTVSDFTYDDVSPWPTAPDGNGKSLELKDPTLDPTLDTSWAASVDDGGTPGALNNAANNAYPHINNVSVASSLEPSTTLPISATVANASSVQLKYIIDFASEVTLTMYDDGAHGDGGSGDGVYSNVVPGASAGALIRYKIIATNSSGSVSIPASGDGQNYRGLVVNDGQSSELPIFRWYMDTNQFNDMTTNHLTDDQQFPAVIAFGGQVYDNALVRVKGQASSAWPKKKFKFEMPDGYKIGAPYFNYAVDEFAAQSYLLNYSDYSENITWRMFGRYGFTPLQNQFVKLFKNSATSSSEFYGHYMLLEYYDKTWRERNNFESGALYKEVNDKKTRLTENNSDIQSLITNLTTLQGDALKQYLYNNLDIPKIINYHAIAQLARHDDWSFYGNIYQYRDTEGTQRWQYLPWDLDSTLAPEIFKNFPHNASIIDPYPSSNDPGYFNNRIIERAMYQFPEFKQLFLRRAATIYDDLYGNTEYVKQWFDELSATSRNTVAQDIPKWAAQKNSFLQTLSGGVFPYEYADDYPYKNFDPLNAAHLITPEIQRDIIFFGENKFKEQVNTYRQSSSFPASQKQYSKILLNEVVYDVNNPDFQFIELYNPESQAVDISGWRLTGGVEHTFQAGSVVPAGGYAVVVKNDVAFRGHYGSGYVLGQYSANINSSTGIMLVRADGSDASIVPTNVIITAAEASSPKKSVSIGLQNTTADESKSSCWENNLDSNGTPSNPNTTQQDNNCPPAPAQNHFTAPDKYPNIPNPAPSQPRWHPKLIIAGVTGISAALLTFIHWLFQIRQ